MVAFPNRMIDYKLIKLTDSQFQQTLHNNYEEWGSPELTIDQYIQRETALIKTPFSRKTFVSVGLIEATDLEMNLLTHCEMYQFDCCLSTHGDLKKGVCYAIASVYTPKAHRKKGYAKIMMEMIKIMVAEDPKCLASTLYSDIGPVYYHQVGWTLHKSESLFLSVSDEFHFPQQAEFEDLFIQARQLDSIFLEDKKSVIDTIRRNSIGIQFASFPSNDSVEWFFVRGVFYAKAFNKLTPERCGVAMKSDSNSTRRPFVVWMHDFNESYLMVLKIRFETPQDALFLLKACSDEARRFGLSKVHIWSPCHVLKRLADEFDAISIVQRESSLSSLFLLNSNLESSVEWLNNEKFAWV